MKTGINKVAMKDKKEGISLLVLIITIIVMIILAGAVILSITNNNPVSKANETKVKTDLTALKDEYNNFYSSALFDNVSNTKGYYTDKMNITKEGNIIYKGKVVNEGENNSLASIMPSIVGTEYEGKVFVADGKIYIDNRDKFLSEEQQEWAKEVGINILNEGEVLVLSTEEVSLKISQKERIYATVLPDADSQVEFEIDEQTRARIIEEKENTVDIQGISDGIAILTAKVTAKDGVEIEKKVTVKVNVGDYIKVERITIDPSEVVLGLDDEQQLRAIITPESADNQDVSWEVESQNPQGAVELSQIGVVTGRDVGEAKIIAKGEYGNLTSEVCSVSVIDKTKITLDKQTLQLRKGQKDTLKATVENKNVREGTLTWETSDDAKVGVDQDGNITAKEVGSATITAKYLTKSVSCVVTVEEPLNLKAEVTEARGTIVILKIDADTTYSTIDKIQVRYKEENATEWQTQEITVNAETYSKDDYQITGLTAEKKYDIEVIAHLKDGGQDKKVVLTATPSKIPVESVTISPKPLQIYHGDKTKKLEAKVLPQDATNKKVRWESSQKDIATIDANGTITPVEVGTTIITAISEDDETKRDTCEVEIQEPITFSASVVKESITSSIIPLNIYAKTEYGNITEIKVRYKEKTETEETKWQEITIPEAVNETEYTNEKYQITNLKPYTEYEIEVSVTISSGRSKKETLEVTQTKKIDVSSITIEPTTIQIPLGNTKEIQATLTPKDATFQGLTWESEKTNIATITGEETATDGVAKATIIAKEIGNTTVTVKSKDNEQAIAECQVQVTEPISLTASVDTGGITETVIPVNIQTSTEHGTISKIEVMYKKKDTEDEYTTQNVEIQPDQTEYNGKYEIKNLEPGIEYSIQVKVTITSEQIKEHSKSINDLEGTTKKINVDSITLDKTEETIILGSMDSLQLTATIQPPDATNKLLTWTSNEQTVAEVDQTGKVTIKGVGSAIITVTSQDNESAKAECKITVINPVEVEVNKPELLPGMTAITFDENGQPQATDENNPDWYSYVDQGNYGTDAKLSHWANAQTADGSQWVWIPRYAYKIVRQPNDYTTEGGEIDIKFMSGTSSTKYIDENGDLQDLPKDYIVHPAFTDESKKEPAYANGGWNEELTGIWVAKYEASKGEGTESQSQQTYPKFVQGENSYVEINIGDMFTLCKNLATDTNNPYGFSSSKVDTHQMKNSEWGAVAYLAQSKYGRNGVEVQQNKVYNNSSGAKTGYGESTSYPYNTPEGQKASTTGNLYGIYDMSGGAYEYTAGYLNNGNRYLKSYGQSLLDETNNKDNKKGSGASTKYVSIYNVGESDTQENNYNEETNKARKGEAIWETSTSGNSSNGSWFGDYSYFSDTLNPFLRRGGSYYNGGTLAGLFGFDLHDGIVYSYSVFRAVLCKKIPVTSIKLDRTEETVFIEEGKTIQLTATVLPENASNKEVTWTTNNEQVATVEGNGLNATVTIKGVGQTKITVTSKENSNVSASCIITVINPVAKIGSEYYDTLQEAFDASSTNSNTYSDIQVLKDITNKTATLSNNKYAKLNLGAHTITNDQGDKATITNEGYMQIVGGGSSTISSTVGNAIKNINTLTINTSGTITSNQDAIDNTKTLTVTKGTITSTGSDSNNSHGINNSSTQGNVNITGGKIEGRDGIRNSGTLTIAGGVINSTTDDAVEFVNGTIDITDGEVTGTNGIYNSNGGTATNKVLTIGKDKDSVNITNPKITVTNIAVYNGTETFTSNFYDGAVTGNVQFYKQDEVNIPKRYEIVVNGNTAILQKPVVYGTNGNQEEGTGKVNAPEILEGMKAIKFAEDGSGKSEETTTDDPAWYAYKESKQEFGTDNTTSRWANAETEDGSQWVWIPRYAYKIVKEPEYTGSGSSQKTTAGGEIDIIFLKGTSNKYEDENGDEQEIPKDYIVHPAFRDETDTQFANGGWDSELTGIWVSKYEAGKGGTEIESTSGKAYPKFVPGRTSYGSYGSLKIGDIFTLCKNLNQSGNPYGFSSSTVDTHQMKNSEWGACVYLAQSKYGRNGVEVTQNKKNGNNSLPPETGYGASTSATYNTQSGQLASTTGNIYGIYDMSGGTMEYTAGYLKGGTSYSSLTTSGQSLVDETNKDGEKKSTKYVSVYEGSSSSYSTNYNNAKNSKRKGEAIWETSKRGDGYTSWFGDTSYFSEPTYPFLLRGGYSSESGTNAGLFYFNGGLGNVGSSYGFRAVSVPL